MSHEIEAPIDEVYSTKGSEWHGLAQVREVIDETVVSRLFPEIVQGEIILDVRGIAVKMGNHKALAADYSLCRPETVGTEFEIVPLHIPKNSYEPITNRQVWDAMSAGLHEVSAPITSAGTLRAGKVFFLSADIGGDKFEVNNNGKREEFAASLNFITSHDGTLGVKAYDSMTRIVCMNTLRASLATAGDVGFTVYHTKNADAGVKNMGELLNAILKGRETFKTDMEYLASVEVETGMARDILAGYFASLQNASKGFATRTVNAIDGIHTDFTVGKGNKGRTLYDLLNGATQYYTSGDGCGKSTDKAGKFFKAQYGSAADHKNAIFNLLMSGEVNLAQTAHAGKEALANTAD